ncbi:hypothetical protein RU07_06055 [Agrobacterium tumefaciens]|uniref:Sll0787 family AIR synthase-like protein n=1 Tax=Agrobacterium tumefaciens TaxID=358 RepID=A0A0D0KW86_AGRTU|nr:hypothetical protein RU07_06055 [Agrobacterium tumefaciens]
MTLEALAKEIATHPSIRGKLDIASSTKALGITAATIGLPGDDAAVIARPEGGFDLFAGEGFIPQFVSDDPWFAGWCGVMVNLSDIAAMGGRATALLDTIWAPDVATAAPLLKGLRDAAAAYGVPIVGGHTNLQTSELGLSVSVLGRATRLISSFTAQAGDVLVAAIDHRGHYRPRFDNWCAALDAPHDRLRGDYELLPQLAEAGLVTTGKDISQGGIAGTALMLAECSRCGFDIDLDAISLPEGAELGRWLRTFPSFGFLLSVDPAHAERVCATFAARDICAEVIGQATASEHVNFKRGDSIAPFWDYGAAPYLSLSKEVSHA